MAIDPNVEQLLTLGEARAMVGQWKGGKRPDISSVFRWALRGCRGVRLETVLVGGQRHTSEAALRRFLQRTTEHTGGTAAVATAAPEVRSPTAHELAEARLKREGL